MTDIKRLDHKIIFKLIKPRSHVLDLGCGDGELLSLLIKNKACHGTGVEIDEKAIYNCMENGVTICHGDIDSSLLEFPDKTFDYVILNESIQEVLHPKKVILDALRIGKKAIVGIPNFCHFSARLQIFFKGRVPVTKQLPYQWYDTPNLRFFSIKDFVYFCQANKIKILKSVALGVKRPVPFASNLFAQAEIFLLEK